MLVLYDFANHGYVESLHFIALCKVKVWPKILGFLAKGKVLHVQTSH